jgi:hypothetical protein
MGGQPFDIVTAGEVQGQQLGHLFVQTGVDGANALVHVIAVSQSETELFIQTLEGSGPPQHPTVTYGTQLPIHVKSSWTEPGALYVFAGSQNTGVGTIHFFVSGDTITDNTGFRSFTMPNDCSDGVGGGSAVTTSQFAAYSPTSAAGSDRPLYLATCTTPRGTTDLVVGDDEGGSLQVVISDGDTTTAQMSPIGLAYVGGAGGPGAGGGNAGGQYFAAFQPNGSNSQPSISHGTTPADLRVTTPFVLGGTGSLNVLFGAVPTAANDGLVLFGATVPPSNTNGEIWTGSVAATDFGALETDPTTVLTKRATIADISTVGQIQNPTFDAGHIYGAGATIGGTTIAQNWFQRDGTPVILEQEIVSLPHDTIDAAGSAPMGPLKQLVVWVQLAGGAYSVRGQYFVCQGG